MRRVAGVTVAMRAAAAVILGVALLVSGGCGVPVRQIALSGPGWGLAYLRVTEAHQHSRGDGVVVAVIDTGVDGGHPALRGRVLPGIDLVPGGTGDGRADLVGHGTGIAGLIAGQPASQPPRKAATTSGAEEWREWTGVAPGSSILPIRVQTRTHVGGPDEYAKGFDFAVARGAKVICVASGHAESAAERAAVARAIAAGVVVVAAAGNWPAAVATPFPGAYDGVLTVGAIDRDGSHADVSVQDRHVVIVAPGVKVGTLAPGGGRTTMSGTSPATAIVAGAVALVRAARPELGGMAAARRLTATAVDAGAPGRDDRFGYGVLNLVGALSEERSTPAPPPGP